MDQVAKILPSGKASGSEQCEKGLRKAVTYERCVGRGIKV